MIVTRPMTDDERAWVAKTWIVHFKQHGKARMSVGPHVRTHHGYVNAILDRPGVTARMACLESSPHVLIGFAVGEPDFLHYVYVAHEVQRRGIGRRLITEAIGGLYADRIECSHPWPRPSFRFLWNWMRLGGLHDEGHVRAVHGLGGADAAGGSSRNDGLLGGDEHAQQGHHV